MLPNLSDTLEVDASNYFIMMGNPERVFEVIGRMDLMWYGTGRRD